LGAYLAKQYHFPRSHQIPVFVGSPKTTPLKSFKSWYDKWRPDALLCLLGEEWEWIMHLGLSPQKEIGLACLNRPVGSSYSGVEENNVLVGELACSLVINHLRDNERGLPTYPHDLLVEGTWREGETLRPSASTIEEIKT
jgi:LacI family transcriptional regulator